MASSSKIRVGIIGYGLSAKVFQIPFLAASPAYELRAIVQRSGGSAQQDHPSCTVYRLADDLFADTDVDLVVVSTPPPTHFDLTSQALKAGKHGKQSSRRTCPCIIEKARPFQWLTPFNATKTVVVEKPFAPTSAECEALIAQAKESKRILSVFQNRRWDADFLTLQKIISEGSLGRLVEFESHFDRDAMPTVAKPAQPGAGVIYDLGVHLIDQALVLFGLPRKISGFLMSQAPVNENGVADACTVLLHYDRGLLVTIKASAVSVDTEQLRFWVRGEQGSYLKVRRPGPPPLPSRLRSIFG